MVFSKSSLPVFLSLSLNLLFFSLVSGWSHKAPPPPSTPTPVTPSKGCTRDALKLGVCANVLNGTVSAVVGTPPDIPCCTLLQGLVDLEVALCLCTAIKANILGINLNVPIALSLLVNTCGKKLPSDFQCV